MIHCLQFFTYKWTTVLEKTRINTFLALCCMLVELEVLKKIKTGVFNGRSYQQRRRPVFLTIFKALACNPAKTVPSLMDELEKCYSPKPTAISLDRVYKIK